MQAYLISLELPTAISESLHELKERVRARFPETYGTAATPHCTLLLNRFVDSGATIAAIERIAAQAAPLAIACTGIGHFPPGACYTVRAEIEKTRELAVLQERLVRAIAPYRDGCLIMERMKVVDPRLPYTVEALANAKELGFPYVGANWVPHMTIGFLSHAAYAAMGKELEAVPFVHRFQTAGLVVYRWESGAWVHAHRFPLGGG